MGLAAVERALARLLTDDVLRARFLADPVGTCGGLGLEGSDVEQVARLASARLRLAGQSLLYKRLQDARKLLPATAASLGPRFDALFLDHARLHPMRPGETVHDDVERFARQLLESMRREGTERRTRETAEYEACWLQASHPRRTLIVRRFAYPVNALVGTYCGGGAAQLPSLRGTVAIWLRLSRGSEIRHRVVSLPR